MQRICKLFSQATMIVTFSNKDMAMKSEQDFTLFYLKPNTQHPNPEVKQPLSNPYPSSRRLNESP